MPPSWRRDRLLSWINETMRKLVEEVLPKGLSRMGIAADDPRATKATGELLALANLPRAKVLPLH